MTRTLLIGKMNVMFKTITDVIQVGIFCVWNGNILYL